MVDVWVVVMVALWVAWMGTILAAMSVAIRDEKTAVPREDSTAERLDLLKGYQTAEQLGFQRVTKSVDCWAV